MGALLRAGKQNFVIDHSSGEILTSSVSRLNHIVAHYPFGDGMTSKVLPIEGSFMSMTYNQSTDHLLISAKANTKWNASRHMICQLSEMMNGEAECEGIDVLQTFYGWYPYFSILKPF